MMMYLFETSDVGAVTTLLVSIPESLGLLVFGIGLILIAVLIRALLAKSENVETHEKAANIER